MCQSYSKPDLGRFFETWCRMWADAKHDGHPAECRWHPLLNAVDQIAKK